MSHSSGRHGGDRRVMTSIQKENDARPRASQSNKQIEPLHQWLTWSEHTQKPVCSWRLSWCRAGCTIGSVTITHTCSRMHTPRHMQACVRWMCTHTQTHTLWPVLVAERVPVCRLVSLCCSTVSAHPHHSFFYSVDMMLNVFMSTFSSLCNYSV